MRTIPTPDTEQTLFGTAINALRCVGQEKIADDLDQRMENLLPDNAAYRFSTFGLMFGSFGDWQPVLHRTEVTDTKKFDLLVEKISLLQDEAHHFIAAQEAAGKMKRPLLGGNSEGEFYPPINL